MSELVVVSWNMQGNPEAWPRLTELASTHQAQVALVQEARAPVGEDWVTHPARDHEEAWRTDAHVDRMRTFASAIVLLDPSLRLTALEPQLLGSAQYGKFAVSHPGQFAVADIQLPGGELVTVISLYGIWDRDERWIFAEATLHRAISDLTIVLQQAGRQNVVLAGDLNIGLGWDHAAGIEGAWAPRYNTVRDRLLAYGLQHVGPFGDQPLDRCACGAGSGCRHVRTFAF